MNYLNYKLFGLSVLLIGLLTFSSCGDDEEDLLPVSERILGTWTIKESVIFGATIPGDGSTLTFNECTSICTGADYLAEDDSMGSFTYSFNSDNTVLIIDDSDASVGGSYSGEWTIEGFTNNAITLKGNTLFGEFIMRFTK